MASFIFGKRSNAPAMPVLNEGEAHYNMEGIAQLQSIYLS